MLSRAGFNKRARELVDEHPETTFVLAYGDIDRFKVFNDLHGTEEGDRLLASIGAMLARALPENSAAAHLRADHFIACIPQDRFDADRFLSELDAWFAAYPANFTFFVRLGLYVIEDPGLDVVLMSDRALIALREAKTSTGRSRWVRYHEGLRDSLFKEQEMVGEMDAALEEGRFVAFFQPQYRYSTRALVGAEVLARWNHPTKGLIGPAEFIPVFERNGLVWRLDYRMWELACRALRGWLDERSDESVPPLSVNLSRADIYRDDLLPYLRGLVKEYAVPPGLLRLEITESAYMEAPEQLVDVVNELRAAGFAVDMDDFGSGYSSLNTLKDVPVDLLKLDMRFLDARNNARGGIILASIVRMAHWLDLPVIAEGVETQSQADYLASIGCDLMQGYLFSHPLGQDGFERLLDGAEGRAAAREDPAVGARRTDGIWDAESHFALLFNRFVGAAAIAEYSAGDERLEVVRGNEEYQTRFVNAEARGYYGPNLLDALDDGDRTACVEELDRIVAEGGDGEFEFRVRRDAGGTRWIRANLRLLACATGVASLFLQLEETTEQQVLRDRLRATIDSIPGGIAFFKVSERGVRLLEFSDAAAELSDCTREQYLEFVSPDARQAIVEEDRPRLQALIDELMAGGERRSDCVLRARRRLGGYRWVHLSSSVVYREEDAVCMAVVLIDVTNEREAQRRLETQAAMQDRLFEAVPCGIIRIEAEEPFRVVSLNREGCAILGYKDFDECLRCTGGDAFSPLSDEARCDQLDIVARLKQGSPPLPFAYRARAADGRILWIEGTSALVEGEGGRTLVQSAFNDVTHRRAEQHERMLRSYADVLCEAYDEVVEIDRAHETSRVVHSSRARDADRRPRPMDEAFDRWLARVGDENDRRMLREARDECLRAVRSKPVTCTYRIEANGKPAWCQTTFLGMADDYVLCCNRDVTGLVTAEDRRAFAHVTDVLAKLPVGVGVLRLADRGVVPLYMSDLMCALLGFSPEECAGLVASEEPVRLPDDVALSMGESDRQTAIEQGIDMELETARRDGEPLSLRVRGRVDADGDEPTAYVIVVDITREVRERRATSWVNERYRLLSELTHAISFDYDSQNDTVLLYIDRTGKGMEAQVIPHYLETLDRTREGVVHPDSIEAVRSMFERVREGATNEIIEYRADYYGTGYQWYRTNLFVVHDEAGSWHLVGLIENIQTERELRLKAESDAITGLSNYASTRDLVESALSDPHVRSHSVCAVVDIDDFKAVNDTLGHIKGDELLHAVGAVLRSNCREADVVGRVGGDEFVLLLKNIGLEVALRKLAAMKREVAALHDAEASASGIHPTISVGACVTGSDDLRYQDVIARADESLYEAKRAGKNRLRVQRGQNRASR